jgi:hypothetical protein
MRDTSSNQSADVLSRTSPILYLACGALMVGVLAIDLVTPSGLAMGVPYIAAVLLSLWSPKVRFIVIIAIACTAYTLVAILHKPSYGELWTIIYDRALALFAIWVTASLAVQRKLSEEKRERAIKEREKALEDVRVLRGLLPICASCKQIRDDEGYWTQIEVYIRDHSEAQFSHGMCPACARKAYPEYFEAHRRESGFGSLIDRR